MFVCKVVTFYTIFTLLGSGEHGGWLGSRELHKLEQPCTWPEVLHKSQNKSASSKWIILCNMVDKLPAGVEVELVDDDDDTELFPVAGKKKDC